MNSSRTLKDQQRDKHPGFDNYLECMTRALFAGLSAFTLGLLLCLGFRIISEITKLMIFGRFLECLLYPEVDSKALSVSIEEQHFDFNARWNFGVIQSLIR